MFLQVTWLFSKIALCRFENISGLWCFLAQFLISTSRCASQNHPIQGPGHWLICCLGAKQPAGLIAAFFLPHCYSSLCSCFNLPVFLWTAHQMDLSEVYFMLFTSLLYQSVLSGYISLLMVLFVERMSKKTSVEI